MNSKKLDGYDEISPFYKQTVKIRSTDPFKTSSSNYLHKNSFEMRVIKKGNRNTKSSADTPSVRPVLECGAACWDPCREGQINALDRVQKKAAQFTVHTKNSD
jgi:hypothetical protein